MAYFLAKSEPGVYSIDQLEKDGKTTWDGVTNPQAVKAILSMKPGDRVFIYHSGGVSAIVGLPKNAKSAVADLEFAAKLDPPTGLSDVKQSGKFADWALVRQSRLSTMAAPETFVEWMRARYPKAKI